ncbi:MAG: alpha/beta hydrolase [Oscillospiraceae bacterium]|nr:alpha/beta hydrolase [Oscillospiraceae bacterium]
MKEQMLQTDKGKVFYWQSDRWDANKDTVFFLHGLTADHSMFDGQIPAFEKTYNLLTWDTPAHGKSRPFKAFDFSDTSIYIKSILDRLSVGRVIFVGQSLGGFLAQSFIKRYPDRVKGFVSIDSTPYGSVYYSRFDIWVLKQVEWMAHMYPFQWMKKAMAKQVSTTQKAYSNMMQMLSPYDKKELCHLMGLGYAGFLDDNCELKIPCPVFLILGEKDKTGKVVQYNKAWTRQTGYPLKIIKDAAHNVNVDKPDEVNACIRDFLSDIT